MSALPARVGHLRRLHVCGVSLIVSPDVWMWTIPTTVTVALAAVCLWDVGGTAWRSSPFSVVAFVAVILTALGASLACGLTDPGIVPCSTLEAPDPYKDEDTWRYCRQCEIRRPPRAAHCYVCGVCVLEHDHHCGVIGGCVGMRSLRWFTLYLVCTATGCGIGCWWLWGVVAPVLQQRQGFRSHGVRDLVSHLALLAAGGGIGLAVGAFALFYLYLTAVGLTRRESKGLLPQSAARTLPYFEDQGLEGRTLWRWLGRLGRVLHPPPSLVGAGPHGAA